MDEQIQALNDKSGTAKVETYQQGSLIGVKVFGIILLIGAFFFPAYLIKWDICKTVWEVWEFAALLWSLSFVIYYLFEYKSMQNFKKDRILLLIIIASMVPPVLSIVFLVKHNAWMHIMWAITLSVFYYILDFLLSIWHKSETERKIYRESFYLADVPTVATNVLLFSWVAIYSDTKEWEAFAGGIIAAQLITCNLIFIVAQSGIIRKIWVSEG